ncbi:MAG TPA: YbbR-like domain-containing protein [Bacteroidales bacterium]|nr:YbbR-like domain-containing protein [Bacteroidales bacterium]
MNKKIRTLVKHPFSREFRIFLIFLAISCFFWLLQSLQEVREVEMRIPVIYSELPPHISITNELPSYVFVTVRDKGTNLYYYYRHRKGLTIRLNILDYYHKEDIGKIPSSTIESLLREKLMTTTQLIRIEPDFIPVFFAPKKAKNVPVRLVSNLNFASQHLLADTPFIHPTTVQVFAPASILKNIERVETQVLSMEELSDTTVVTVGLKPIKGARFSVNTVEVRLCVEEFTERTFSIPVEGLHFPIGHSLLSFPPTVNIRFFLGLSVYNKIKASDFQAVVDYKDFLTTKNNVCKVRLIKRPEVVQNIRIQPESVECLSEKSQ